MAKKPKARRPFSVKYRRLSEAPAVPRKSWWISAKREGFSQTAARSVTPDNRVTHMKPID